MRDEKARPIPSPPGSSATARPFAAVAKTFRDIEPKNGMIEVHCAGAEGREMILQALEIVPSGREITDQRIAR